MNRFVWRCNQLFGYFADGPRCHACSRKPTTKVKAEQGLAQHLRRKSHSDEIIYQLAKYERW